ncbi:hemin uptake protein HemP [Lysobacter cavernae]|uniref:Hemin uptake protein HemP n=1 Tax=Lysobacter cavernae TaxID=1685901 RepID=A0ABV7RQ23_9GAMM
MSLRPQLLQLKPRSDHSALPLTVVTAAAAVPGTLVESNALLRGGREVLIRHGGDVYRLRHTRNDKLILTK